MRLQLRARRAVALVALALLSVAGLAGLRHESTEVHVFDPTTGTVVHAHRMAGHHEAGRADIHAVGDRDVEAGACEIVAALHAPARATAVPTVAAVRIAAPRAHAPPPARAPLASREAAYRVAPKTSPPTAA